MATNMPGFRALGNINAATGAFTEITGGGYARQPITLQPDANSRLTNAADVTHGPVTGAAWPRFSAVAVYDAATAGNLVLWYETNQPSILPIGGSLVISAGRMSLAFPAQPYTVHGTPVHVAKNIDVSGKTVVVNGT